MVRLTGGKAQKHPLGKWESMQRATGKTGLRHNVSLSVISDSSGGLKLMAFSSFSPSPPVPSLCSHTVVVTHANSLQLTGNTVCSLPSWWPLTAPLCGSTSP